MDLSKIPFLKNLDLSNAQTRKSALMLLGGVVAILVFILLNIPRAKDGDADVQNQAATQSSQAPPIQDGADKDNLQGKTLIEVRERKNDNGSFARRIFDDSNSSVEDILRGTDSQGADPVTASGSNSNSPSKRRRQRPAPPPGRRRRRRRRQPEPEAEEVRQGNTPTTRWSASGSTLLKWGSIQIRAFR